MVPVAVQQRGNMYQPLTGAASQALQGTDPDLEEGGFSAGKAQGGIPGEGGGTDHPSWPGATYCHDPPILAAEEGQALPRNLLCQLLKQPPGSEGAPERRDRAEGLETHCGGGGLSSPAGPSWAPPRGSSGGRARRGDTRRTRETC